MNFTCTQETQEELAYMQITDLAHVNSPLAERA